MAIINVLLVTNDVEYSHRLLRYITERHTNVRLTILDNADNLNSRLNSSTDSVVLIGEEFRSTSLSLPHGINCGYLCSRDAGGEINGFKCFCKYRSGEVMYNVILGLYSEVSADLHIDNSNGCPIYAFTSAGGGMGATTVSAGFAVKLASEGQKVLYHSFDKYSLFDELFSFQPHSDMSDFIYSVIDSEHRDINLSAKAASNLSTDNTGVKFMNASKNAEDLEELTPERLSKAFNAIRQSDDYDAIVVDVPLADRAAWSVIELEVKKLFMLTGQGKTAKQKLSRALEQLKIRDARGGTALFEKCAVILNRDSHNQGMNVAADKEQNSIPMYKDESIRAVVNAISRLALWNNYV